MSDVKKALEELKHTMFNPTRSQKLVAENPYFLYTIAQLHECMEEISMEIDSLPPYAFKRLEELYRENQQIREVIDLLYPEDNKDVP